jgi:flagellar FliJ protein
MTKTALHTVLERAEAERDLALAALRRAEEQARRAQAQAEQLLSYRGETQQRWSSQFGRRGEIEIVQCYRSFMTRLDEAIGQQNGQAAATGTHCERLRERLAAAEVRVASVRKLIERRLAEHGRALARHEQRQSDEAAQQQHWRHARAEPV